MLFRSTDKDATEYSAELSSSFHKTIKKVTEDIENMKFNTAIAALMTISNQVYDNKAINGAEAEGLLALIAWPTYDEAKCVDETIEIAVQVSGKIKNRINVPADIDEAGALELAKADEKVAAALEGKTIIKELYVKGRLVNIVAK